GVHTYDEEGVYDGTVKIVSPANQTTNLTFTATVLDVLTAKGVTLDEKANEAFDLTTVATFSNPDADANKGNFSARTCWGDGYQPNGVIANGGGGQFKVEGSHTYVGHTDATHDLKVVITDDLGSTIEADGKANVTFAPTPPTSSGTAPAPNPPGTPAGPQG